MRDPLTAEQSGRTACLIVDENRKLGIRDLVEAWAQQTEKTNPDVFVRLKYLLMGVLKETDLLSPEDRLEGAASAISSGSETYQPISESQADELAGYLLDWVDTFNNTDPEHNTDRAEESCPVDGLPYSAKNGKFDSTDEIGLVCGFRQVQKHVIEELARNLTVFDIQRTNINTATQPVLHAFVAQVLGATEEYSGQIYDLLHPLDELELPEDHVVQNTNGFRDLIGLQLGLGTDVTDHLKNSMGIASTIFRVGVNGIVIDLETGGVEANSRVNMVISFGASQTPGQQGSAGLLYYREG